MLTTLAIHTEAWLQEEINAQQAMLRTLERLEGAARGGHSDELSSGGQDVEALLATAGPRETRRRLLLGRLATALKVPMAGVSLSRVVRRLQEEGVETERMDRLRYELRGIVAATLKAGRRLGAIAKYHRELFEEVCGVFTDEAPAREGSLIDAKG